MMQQINNLIHGRETYAVYYGDKFVMKRPLPTLSIAECDKWLDKQHHAMTAINKIRMVENPAYNVPLMHFINDDEYQVLEERAPGRPLSRDLYRALSRRQQYDIINGIANFLVDMHESSPAQTIERHKISDELKMARLSKFIRTKMSIWFTKNEIRQMSRIHDQIMEFEYDTRQVWTHCDLNPGNILYEPDENKLSFIDFADCGYSFVYRDIFGPVPMELEIYKYVYEAYKRLHNKSLFPMPSIKNEQLREIMKYRVISIAVKRFIKASDDLRVNPANQKSINNNIAKVAFMREQMQQIQNVEHRATKMK